MARALAQRSSDESKVGSQDALRRVVVPLAARREGSHGVKGNEIWEFEFAQIGNGVCFAIAGRAAWRSLADRTGAAARVPFAQQQQL
jgi:hypothetical protein